MGDLISRQEAQRLYGKALTYKERTGKLTWTTSEVKQWLADCTEQLPPAQPEQRTGEWIDGIIPNDSGGLPVIVCDQCNTFFPLQFGDGHNFCPNCGAKMEGVSE